MQKTYITSGLVVVVLTGLLIFQALRANLSSVVSVGDLLSGTKTVSNSRIRLSGRVADRPINYTLKPVPVLEFFLVDPKGSAEECLKVVFPGPKPDLFKVGRDVLVDGEYREGVFRASNLLTQCPSKYEPAKNSSRDNKKEIVQ